MVFFWTRLGKILKWQTFSGTWEYDFNFSVVDNYWDFACSFLKPRRRCFNQFFLNRKGMLSKDLPSRRIVSLCFFFFKTCGHRPCKLRFSLCRDSCYTLHTFMLSIQRKKACHFHFQRFTFTYFFSFVVRNNVLFNISNVEITH